MVLIDTDSNTNSHLIATSDTKNCLGIAVRINTSTYCNYMFIRTSSGISINTRTAVSIIIVVSTTGNINIGMCIRISITVNTHIGIAIRIRLDMRINTGFRNSLHILLLLISTLI